MADATPNRPRPALRRPAAPFQALRALAVLCALALAGYFCFDIVTGAEPAATVVVCALVVVFLLVFAYLCLNPDTLRSQYTEQTLSMASGMLADMTEGLTPASARSICRCLLPETRAMTIAVTDGSTVLACEGELEADFPPGSPIHTPATRYALEHGIVQSFTNTVSVQGEGARPRRIGAGIVAPLKVRGKAVGTLKFYYRSSRDVNRTQFALASGFAELISTQLATHELDHQAELTARAEVRALQAQINPHFLYNTLDSIAWMCEDGRSKEAVSMVNALARLFRISISKGHELIPVAKEVEHAKSYLQIQKFRYKDQFDYAFEVEEGCSAYYCNKITLQPLIENAIYHGLNRMIDEGFIRIRIYEEGEELVFCVEDNGVGMTAEQCAAILTADSGQGGIGMKNVNDRVKIYFGAQYGMKIESEPDVGTKVYIRMPKLREESYEYR